MRRSPGREPLLSSLQIQWVIILLHASSSEIQNCKLASTLFQDHLNLWYNSSDTSLLFLYMIELMYKNEYKAPSSLVWSDAEGKQMRKVKPEIYFQEVIPSGIVIRLTGVLRESSSLTPSPWILNFFSTRWWEEELLDLLFSSSCRRSLQNTMNAKIFSIGKKVLLSRMLHPES